MSISPARQATESFRKAVRELDSERPAPLRRTFTATAREIRQIANDLATLLEIGTPLGAVDELSQRLVEKCLDVQRQTLRARKDGVR